MKKINKEEMFGNLKRFLRSKGVELQDGSYTDRIRRGCGLLADSVNLSQQAMKRAKTAVDKRLDQMRQAIHEKTAPKPPVYPKAANAGPPKATRTGRKPRVASARKGKPTPGRSRSK